MKVISYIRVSSTRQGKSGLGMEAQMSAIYSFCGNEGMEIIGNFQDVDSGAKDNRRGLENALQVAKEEGATIVVAKLDRLSRDVHYISGLMKHGVPFIVAELGKDIPTFMLHVYASFAQLEREMIGKRTKEALAEAKKRGVKLGTHIPKVKEASMKATKERGENTMKRVIPHIIEAKNNGCNSNRTIADYLNEKGIQTPRGSKFSKASMTRYLRHMKAQPQQLNLFQNNPIEFE
jgi:DNA invertase Pin-like site-specific DNA recombinase